MVHDKPRERLAGQTPEDKERAHPPLNLQKLLGRPQDDIVHVYSQRDVILYALSIGIGTYRDSASLNYLYEKGLKTFPTMAAVLATPPPWTADLELGIDRSKVVHGRQGLVIHEDLATGGEVRGRERMVAVHAREGGRGVVVMTERTLRDAVNDRLIATLTSEIICRGDSIDGGTPPPQDASRHIPATPPDDEIELPTTAVSALLYRLNGDLNPLHVDPAAAAAAGFPVPILHGLCSWGMAAHAVVRSQCAGDARRLRQIECRFSRPVFPGELLTFELWRSDREVLFRAWVKARHVKVLDEGYAVVSDFL